MNNSKQPERRTFLQDRLDILIKRQKTGKATFDELTELDRIVNSDPEIRKRIIFENLLIEKMMDFNDPSNNLQKEDKINLQKAPHQSLLNRVKSIISRIFFLQITGINKRIINRPGSAYLLLC
jgi:hypothetical protein